MAEPPSPNHKQDECTDRACSSEIHFAKDMARRKAILRERGSSPKLDKGSKGDSDRARNTSCKSHDGTMGDCDGLICLATFKNWPIRGCAPNVLPSMGYDEQIWRPHSPLKWTQSALSLTGIAKTRGPLCPTKDWAPASLSTPLAKPLPSASIKHSGRGNPSCL
ncbi:Hypothetical predicted protein [Xyrichtys novacula]|uniref:Uncharacterized protein n=1 Tax=Xyrichtys novacula TaxID=13765 RepID=A0AAV1EXI7_XYRNO|nr:Hypothetical predicted protein [Xyrichtys novacula]